MVEPNRPLTVLQSVPEPKPTTNPYVVQLIDALRSDGVEVMTFSWRTALRGRYDVFHVHWPEVLVRGSSPLRAALRQAAVLVVLLRCRVRRTPIVRTLHNPSRHESGGRPERWLLDLFDRWTTFGIAINDLTPPPRGLPIAVIPHGHYRDWFAAYAADPQVAGRLAYFGLIRAYKGVEQLITAFRELPGDGLSLTVSGAPRTPELAAELHRLAADDERIALELSYVSDGDLVRRVSQSELVVLPYRQMHNSGAALAALSLNRPVLVPDNEINARLAGEVGPGWVFTFAGETTTERLRQAIQELDTVPRAATPDLSRRDWARAATDHRAAYLEAIDLAGRRRPKRARRAGS